MAEINLIGNSGVQFHRINAKIEKDKLRQLKYVYFEDVELNKRRFWLEELIFIAERDAYCRKSELMKIDAFTNDGKLKPDLRWNELRVFSEGQPQVFEVGNIQQVLKSFKNKWLPLPYFKNNSISRDFFGPTDWVRIYINQIDQENLELILAIDTTLAEGPEVVHSPELNENPQENKFSLCKSDDLILHYFEPITECKWVEDYILPFFKIEDGESQTMHLASYIFLIRFLNSLEEIPTIQMLSDRAGVIDVDLTIDVGNSNTCALLFENPNDIRFNLNKVKQLDLVDLSNPQKTHKGSFSTRLVFHQPDFGFRISELNQYKKFKWSSFVRIGEEAERLISEDDLDASIRLESKSYHSSPKRYLCDDNPQESDWNFLNERTSVPKPVFLNGISEQLKSDGSICADGVFGANARYSKKSLMTFVFLEILTQAHRQINSFEFRSAHGSNNSKRRIKRILISCPTAMIKQEQIALRACANDAVILFNNFNNVVKSEFKKLNFSNESTEIIPSISTLSVKLDQLESRKDWIYDEATAAQFLYLFGSIQHKFDGNAELFFKLYGKPALFNQSKKKIVVGSLDIGAGTTDLMICEYSYEYNDSTTIHPDPIYWESFHFAGDELLKQIIQEIIIEGVESDNDFEACSGVILNYGKKNGISDIVSRLNGFFGKNNANMGYKASLMRVSFLNQIGLPIAHKFLSVANDKSGIIQELDFETLFKNNKPNKELLIYFARHFGFKFEELKWEFNPEKVNRIISNCYSKLFEQITKIMHLHRCDVVLLSGRPFSLESLEKSFMKLHPVNPNRLINLNHYWIGKWFPFCDNHGYINDSKTVVAVGSLLSMMGGKIFKLDNFRIDTKKLRTKISSTANYIGNWDNFIVSKSFMGPETEETKFKIYDIPYHIGFKNIDSSNYPSRLLYTLQFHNNNIKTNLGHSSFGDSLSVMDALEDRKNTLRSKLPYTVTLTRDFTQDKEKIKLELIQDKEDADLTKSNFELKLQTLDHSEGFWLDSGEFNLSVE
jgi:hypothetical protein